MRKIIILSIVLIASSVAASGFDDTILWPREIDMTAAGINSDPHSILNVGFRAQAMYTNPYQIGRLHWNDLFAKRGFARWGVYGRFNSYGLDEYYNRYSYELGFAIRAIDSLAVLTGLRYRQEKYLGLDNFSRWELDSRAAYRRARFSVMAGVSGLKLSEDHNSGYVSEFRPWGACSYDFSDGNSFSVSVKQFSNGKARWLFGQSLTVSSDLNLTIGYINRPDLIFGKIVFRRGSFLLDFAYYSVSKLNDTIVVGIGYRR